MLLYVLLASSTGSKGVARFGIETLGYCLLCLSSVLILAGVFINRQEDRKHKESNQKTTGLTLVIMAVCLFIAGITFSATSNMSLEMSKDMRKAPIAVQVYSADAQPASKTGEGSLLSPGYYDVTFMTKEGSEETAVHVLMKESEWNSVEQQFEECEKPATLSYYERMKIFMDIK